MPLVFFFFFFFLSDSTRGSYVILTFQIISSQIHFKISGASEKTISVDRSKPLPTKYYTHHNWTEVHFIYFALIGLKKKKKFIKLN